MLNKIFLKQNFLCNGIIMITHRECVSYHPVYDAKVVPQYHMRDKMWMAGIVGMKG